MATKFQKLFLDTNILLDVFDSERIGHVDAQALLWYCMENQGSVELVASITSFKDTYYVLSRLLKDEAQARDFIDQLTRGIVTPVDMLTAYGKPALACDERDFEDALIRICAEAEQATVLISRDQKAFESSSVPHMSAGEYLAQQEFDYGVVEF